MKPILLSSKNLTLRQAVASDSEILFRNYTADFECSKFLTRLSHSTIEETSAFLNKWCSLPWQKETDKFAWVVSLKENNEAIGIILVLIEGHKAQIHFGIARKFWRQGYATECCDAVVQWLMKQPQLERIWTVCDLLNHGSIKVLEKLNFQNEGLLRKWLILPAFGPSARDCYIFSRTWNANEITIND